MSNKNLVSLDYSQAELRIAAWESNDTNMIEAYRNGHDLHAVTASGLSNMSLDEFFKLDDDDIEKGRFKAKATNFGLIYTMKLKTFGEYCFTMYGLELSEYEYEQLYNTWFNLYPRIQPWQEERIALAYEQGYVRSLHGRKRNLPNLYSSDNGIRKMAERQAVNATVQNFASDLGLIASNRLYRDLYMSDNLDKVKQIMFIHDANVFEIEEKNMEIIANIKWYMENPPLKEWFNLESPVPFVADVEVGTNLAETKKRKDIVAEKPKWKIHDEVYSID